MSISKQLLSKGFYFLRIIFIIIWLSNISLTDAYMSVYVIIAFSAFYCTVQNSKENIFLSQREHLVFLLISFIFSLITIVANYHIFTRVRDLETIQSSTNTLVNSLNLLFSFIGGMFVGYPILQFVYFKLKYTGHSAVRSHDKKHLFWFSAIVFCVIFSIYAVHLFLVEYPGNVTEDPFTQIGEMCSGEYSHFNTFWHTIFLQGVLSVGYSIFSDVNSAIAFYCIIQAFIMAVSFTYCITTLYLAGIPNIFLFISFLIYAILPYNIALSITIWKDVLFAAGSLLMLSALYRILHKIGFKMIWNYIVLIIGCFFFALSRNNGWYVFLISLIIFIWPLRSNRLLLACLSTCFIIFWIMTNPLISLLGVSGTDYTEALSVPLQQVSRVIADGCELTAEEEALISQVLDIDEVPELYTNWLSDPIKIEFRSNNTAYFEDNVSEYVRLWLKLGARYPFEYLKAWVDQTKGYWNGGYGYGMYSESITENPYGVEKAFNQNLVATLSHLYFGFSRHVIFFEPLHSIGLHVWITALCCILNAMLRRKEWILSVPLLVIVLGLCLGSPVYACFRYAYPVFTCFPLIVGTTLYPCPNE